MPHTSKIYNSRMLLNDISFLLEILTVLWHQSQTLTTPHTSLNIVGQKKPHFNTLSIVLLALICPPQGEEWHMLITPSISLSGTHLWKSLSTHCLNSMGHPKSIGEHHARTSFFVDKGGREEGCCKISRWQCPQTREPCFEWLQRVDHPEMSHQWAWGRVDLY